MNSRTVITVDGLAGSGKTTLARLLAERLGYVLLNSGLLYRASAFLVRESGVDTAEGQKIAQLIREHKLSLEIVKVGSAPRMFIDGVDRTDSLAAPEVSEVTSIIAALPQVRAELVDAQRHVFPQHNIIAEGRDMGTVIFPDAALKFFILADQEVRIKRRIQQLYGESPTFSENEAKSLKRKIEIEIIERDQRDQERAVSPTIEAPGAVRIDNSRQTLTFVVQSMYDAVLSRGLAKQG